MAEGVDRSFQLLATRYLRKQLAALIRHVEDIPRGKKVEALHQARVASRRLRAGLSFFRDCFGPKRAKKWRNSIGRLTRRLSEARDVDVQMQFVREFLAGLKDPGRRVGVRRLLLRLEQRRKATQPKVLKAVRRLVDCGVVEEISAARPLAMSYLRSRGGRAPSAMVFRHAQERILARLAKLLDFQDSLADPQAKERHHAMRIAAKRLRYTMEICSPIYEGQLDEHVKTVKRLQTLLGEIHDCDVWIDWLPEFLSEERQRTLDYFGHDRPVERIAGGIQHLLQDRRNRRDTLFAELNQQWAQLAQEAAWDKLASVLQSGVDRAAEQERARERAKEGGSKQANEAKATPEAHAPPEGPEAPPAPPEAPAAPPAPQQAPPADSPATDLPACPPPAQAGDAE